jgi:2-iminobutanoate/2-iminopropanoate deaminase
VKTTFDLVDLAEFATVNEPYAEFIRPPYPARPTVGGASLARETPLEVEAIARRR